jgi:hypothetical protein
MFITDLNPSSRGWRKFSYRRAGILPAQARSLHYERSADLRLSLLEGMEQQIGEKAVELDQNPSSNEKPDGCHNRGRRKVLEQILHD